MGDWLRSVAGRLTGPVGLPRRKPVSDARGPAHLGTDVCRVFFGLTERRGGALYYPAGPANLRSDIAVSPSAFSAANCPHLNGVRSRQQAGTARWKTRHVLRCRVGISGFAPMSAIQALPSASPKADDAFQGSSGQDVPAQVELIHFGLDGNIRFLRIPAGWGRR